MEYQRIQLDDLVEPGESAELAALNENVDGAYDLIAEEITNFLDKPKEEEKQQTTSFFSHVPNTALKVEIDKFLKNKNKEEERIRKHLQFEFDKKMQRINKIKSKTYRRMRRREKTRKEEELGINESENSSIEDDLVEESVNEPEKEISLRRTVNPETLKAAELTIQQQQVKLLFGEEDSVCCDSEFIGEKAAAAEADAPKVIETVLPGWDEWAGEGLVCRKSTKNTVVTLKGGIRTEDRKDFKMGHVIINEHVSVPEKYKSELPYGYSFEAYKNKMAVPVSMETNSIRIFNKFVKLNNNSRVVPGKNIKPAEYEPEY